MGDILIPFGDLLCIGTEMENKAMSIGQLLYCASPFTRRASLYFFLSSF